MKHKNQRATFRLQLTCITHGDDGIAPRPWRRPLSCLQIALFFFGTQWWCKGNWEGLLALDEMQCQYILKEVEYSMTGYLIGTFSRHVPFFHLLVLRSKLKSSRHDDCPQMGDGLELCDGKDVYLGPSQSCGQSSTSLIKVLWLMARKKAPRRQWTE